MSVEERALPPRPVPDADTQPFWDGVAERRLLVQRCAECGRWIWQPKPVCPFCQTPDPPWHEVTGEGTVVSWTVVHPPVLPVWQDAVPFVVVLVELYQGVRMVGQLVDDDGNRVRGDDDLEMGAPAHLAWRVDEGGQILPAWALAASA